MTKREGSEDEVEVSRGSDESGLSDSSSSSKGGQDSERSSDSSGGSGSGESGSGTSSSAAAESGDEEREAQSDRVGDVEEEDETDLFTSDNEDYRRTNASSSLSIPNFPVVNRPQHNRSNPGRGRGQSGRYNDRGPPLLPRPGSYQQRNHYGSGPGNRRPERLIAELRLSMSEETLSRKCPAFQEPSEIANYSRAPDGTVHFDSRCLRPFRRKILEESGFDLNEGYETFVEKREDLECHGFGDLLACIRNKSIPLDNIHFVTFRNNLNKILETAYNRRQPWEMGVHKRNGTVYLDVHKLPERPKTELDRRRTYWGYSFEKFATAQIDEEANENSSVVDANVEYCAVVRTKLGAHRIIMGAEIDCYDVNRDDKKYYVELKTSHEVDDRFIETFERDKLLKFWIQSFIAGVPRVVIGFRGDDGRLTRTFAINTRDITQKVKAKNYWQGGVCLAFADEVLCWLYGTVKEDENYTLQFVPQSHRLELLQADTCPNVITNHLDLLRDY